MIQRCVVVTLSLCSFALVLTSAGPTAVGVENPISSEVSASFTIGATGNVTINGDTFPGALVTLLIDGAVVGTTVADGNGDFSETLTGIEPGDHTVGAYATDKNGQNTATVSVSVTIVSGSTVTLSGLLFPPSFSFEAVLESGELGTFSYLRPREAIVTGFAVPNGTLTVFIDGTEASQQLNIDADGAWSGNLNVSILHLGDHTAQALVQTPSGATSDLSNALPFIVNLSADIKIDDLVNTPDFSVLLFNWANVVNKAADINDDTAADLVDLSVMLYYWTG